MHENKYHWSMSQNSEEILQEIIRKNMGDNSLQLFQQFYQGDSLAEQYRGAVELFTDTFGREQTRLMLLPLAGRLKEQA